MPRLYPQYRSTDCIAVKHNIDLPDPVNPLSHRMEFSCVSHLENSELLVSHILVPGCFFIYAALRSTVASDAPSHLKRSNDIWLLLTKSSRAFISVILSYTLCVSLSCNTSKAQEIFAWISLISLSIFSRVLCRNGYATRRPATLMASVNPVDEGLLSFWHSSYSSWTSSSQFVIDVSMLLTKLRSSAWKVRLDRAFSRDWKVSARPLSLSVIPASSESRYLYEL